MTVELKNDLKIRGTLHSIDEQMNLQVTNANVLHSGVFDSCGGEIFVRGNTVRYIHLDQK